MSRPPAELPDDALPPDSGEPDSASLIDRAVQGDRAAVDLLLERHLPGLRAFIRLRAGPVIRRRESESDLAQSVCRDVLLHLDRFQHREPNAFKRWLYTTALRKLMNRFEYYAAEKRDARREHEARGGEGGAATQGIEELWRTFTTPSQHAMKREEAERLEAAFDALDEPDREVISLAHVVGLSRAEIAAHLGKSEGAVRTQLSRALAQLAELVTRKP